MNYNKWEPKNWETDLSNIDYLFFESLCDTEKGLVITLSNKEDDIFEILFENHPAYRSILEEYKLNLWAIKDNEWNHLGNTWIVENSDWLSELKKEEPLITHVEKQLKHYLISTQSAIIEVLSSDKEVKIKTVHNNK
jgi:hypothetical protein